MKDNLRSFLMIGQSNMAGRGYLKDVKPVFDEQIKKLVNGRWQTMTEPLNFDRPTSGIGPAATFAGAWRLKNADQQIGLVPCAEGGASLDDWKPGGALFDHAVCQAKLAQRISTLDGILWHQGENDSFGGRSAVYTEKLSAIIQALRSELDTPDIPLIVGGLGDFLSTGRYGSYFTEYNAVNSALLEYARSTANTYFASAAGLTANADGLHFNAISQRRFGIRYFEAYDTRKDILKPLATEDELINTIQNRPLTKTERTALLEISFAGGNMSLADFESELSILNASA